MKDARPIIFVRGTGRCGSKTLAHQLGLHPSIAKVPVNQCLPEDLIDWTDSHVRKHCPELTDEALGAACRAYFQAYCSCLVSEPGIILHKGTMNVHRLMTLLELWPESKIVYLVRHPIHVVPAYISADIVHYKGAFGYDATVVNSLLRWANDVLAYIRSPVFGHERVLHVRFEEMISNTRKFFQEIYHFIGVDDSVTNNLPGPVEYDDEFVLNEDDRRWIINSAEPILSRLGYKSNDYSLQVPDHVLDRTELYPQRRLSAQPPTVDAVHMLRQSIEKIVKAGQKRIGLFGAGYLSHLIATSLSDMPGDIVCFFDESPLLIGTTLGEYPINHPRQATDLGIEAVIPITLVHQERLVDRWRCLYEERIPIIELWPENKVETVCV